ncbi:MAG: type II toxin-antitoxin system VapC family toxin [Chloroflexi bacterium]|nr:type II toxin-antitoxin system VapC family toxin [Chloroflexota bacterium]
MIVPLRSLLLDSSVVVKWFRNETDSDKALAIQEEFLKGNLDVHISELTLYETANALRYSGDHTADQIGEYLESIVTLGIAAYAFDWDVLKLAIEGSFAKGVSIYDAYLVSLAKSHGHMLLTADAKLLAKVGGYGDMLLLRSWRLAY